MNWQDINVHPCFFLSLDSSASLRKDAKKFEKRRGLTIDEIVEFSGRFPEEGRRRRQGTS